MGTNSEWRADISQYSTVSTPNGPGPAFPGPSESMHLVLYLSWIRHELQIAAGVRITLLLMIFVTSDIFFRTQFAWSSF